MAEIVRRYRLADLLVSVANGPGRRASYRRAPSPDCVEVCEARHVLSAVYPAYVSGAFTFGDASSDAPYGLENTFLLESNPGASKTIFLDFDGHHSVNNVWGHNIVFPAFNRTGSAETFAASELIEIQKQFQNVAEDFAPFNVNVTTIDPGVEALRKTSSSDTKWGIRAVNTQPTGGFGNGIGGIAYLNSFSWSTDTPVFVFNKGARNGGITNSHEIGHALGLQHNGLGSLSYHPGTGTDDMSWGPILGAPYGKRVTQWSKGDYAGATIRQDALSIISNTRNGFGYKPDDHGDSITASTALIVTDELNLSGWGIIGRPSDKDWFSFVIGDGTIELNVEAFGDDPNLDVLATVYDSSGNVVAFSNPLDSTNALLSIDVVAGKYFLAVEGIGLAGRYSDYGSLGFFSVKGTRVKPESIIGEARVTNASTMEDVQTTTGLQISWNESVGAEVTHFKITGISGGSLFHNDGTTPIADEDFITLAQAGAGLKFTPTANSIVTGRFTAQASKSNDNAGLGGRTVTANITVTPLADTPGITNTATFVNTQSSTGLVINRNVADGGDVTHFRTSNITGGTLYQNNGITVIKNGTFITYAQANAGLKFTPSVNSLATGYFTVEASKSQSIAGIGGSPVVAEVAVIPAPIGTIGSDNFVLTYFSTSTAGNVTVTVSTDGGAVRNLGTFPMTEELTVNGLGGKDTVRVMGTNGADVMAVNSLDRLTINGASLLLSSIENRTLTGTAGNDTYIFDADTALGFWTLDETGGGTDTVDFSTTTTVGMYLNLGTASTQVVHSTNLSLNLRSASTFENVVGGSRNDTLIGNAAANVLTGNAGNDILNGAAGNDSMIGGPGNDTYLFGVASVFEADIVTEDTSAGTDTLNFSTLKTHIVLDLGATTIQTVHSKRTLELNSATTFENAVGGSGNDTLGGNSAANVLTGNSGNDILAGRDGDDKLFGGNGRDILIGGLGRDTVQGDNGDDILVAGQTAYDAGFNDLSDLRSAWSSSSTFTNRVATLRRGLVTATATTSLKAKLTVLDDAATIDTLIGGGGIDWYFRALDDVISDFLPGEIADVL